VSAPKECKQHGHVWVWALIGTAWVTSPSHKAVKKTVLFHCRASISGSEAFS